jgi:uncharacterized membrane protein YdjX (TVP38/TMEM64 family)
VSTEARRHQRRIKALSTLVVVGVLFLGAQWARSELGIEWSPASIQESVAQLGLLAPVGFLLMATFRQFLALPSVLILTSAGLLFGAALGSLLGGLGITLNALLLFLSGRFMGADWVFARLHARFPKFESHANSAGPAVIAFVTAHPAGPQTPIHFAAGATTIRLVVFVLVVFPTACFRAACYSFLGANILEPGSPRFWIASGVLVVVSLLPLLHPGLRSRLVGQS